MTHEPLWRRLWNWLRGAPPVLTVSAEWLHEHRQGDR